MLFLHDNELENSNHGKNISLKSSVVGIGIWALLSAQSDQLAECVSSVIHPSLTSHSICMFTI